MSDVAETQNSKLSLRKWLVRALISGALFVVAVAALEAGLRLTKTGFDTALLVPCTLQGQPASCYNLFFPAPFFPPGMIKSPQVYAIPKNKSPQTYRIFVLGESAAMGDPDPAYGFSRYLEVMLRERYPEKHFEVVNTGSVAINSHVLLPIAKGLAEQKPDLFIIYSGNNEVVGPYGPGTALTSSGMWMPFIRSSIYYHETRIGQLLTKLGSPKREWGGMEMFLDKQVPASSPLMPRVYANYEQNLRDTITAARQAGARVIVSTVGTNLRDCAPFGSMHRTGLSAADLQRWTTLVEEASQAEQSAQYAEALDAYQQAAKIDDQYAELEFRIARMLQKLGKVDPARDHFSRARDLDTLRFRADSRINEINRSVARSAGAELVDTDDLFAKASGDDVTGSDLIYEHVHMTPAGNYLLARAMFAQIASKFDRPVPVNDIPSEAQCEQWLAFTPHDRMRLAREMYGRLQRPPFTTQLNHAEQLLKLSNQAELADPDPRETAAEYLWAIRQQPGDRVLHYNFGLFLFNFNPNAAAEQLRLSRPWDDFPVFAPDGTLL